MDYFEKLQLYVVVCYCCVGMMNNFKVVYFIQIEFCGKIFFNFKEYMYMFIFDKIGIEQLDFIFEVGSLLIYFWLNISVWLLLFVC